MRPLNIMVWHVHGSYLGALVHGCHQYLLPVDAAGNGGRRDEWPANVRNVTDDAWRDQDVDLIVAQRTSDLEEAARLLSPRVPGPDIPIIYIEHNTPQGRINEMRHPLADRDDLTFVHVTHFNALFWDVGTTPTRIVEHGVPDPGYRYTGELPHAVAVINEAKRRGRVTGTDLLPQFEAIAPVDLFGIGTPFDIPQSRLHPEMGRRRVYLHPYRWTSLGLALIEAMLVGMPIVALSVTEQPVAIPSAGGIVSNDLRVLREGMQWLIDDPGAARTMGQRARAHALERYGIARFLADWDTIFAEAVAVTV